MLFEVFLVERSHCRYLGRRARTIPVTFCFLNSSTGLGGRRFLFLVLAVTWSAEWNHFSNFDKGA